jgi:glycolate oxidase
VTAIPETAIPEIVARLRAALPAAVVELDPDAIASRSSDSSDVAGADGAIALLRPQTAEQVALILRTANETRTPVVPQGALTGVAGAASAVPGALLLDLRGMNRITTIDATEMAAVVQPGVVVADLQAAVGAQDLFYAPDPGSAATATIGGTIATNAGGMRAVKYGVTRDSVRSLQVVLADGTITRTRRPTIKGVAGLDLTGLIVGSEGTLAVITEATLALRPAPDPPRGVVGTFPDIETALSAANAIVSGSSLLSTLELMDGTTLAALRRYRPNSNLPDDAQAWLLAATDTGADASAELATYEQAFHAHGALTVARAETAAEFEDLMAARRDFFPAIQALRGTVQAGDVGLPRARLGEFVARLPSIMDRFGVEIAITGHAGDGNLHPLVPYEPDNPEQARVAHAASEALVQLAQELGGTMTAEHGVGTQKLPELDAELAPELRAIQHAIKTAFDPHGILNPGKKY